MKNDEFWENLVLIAKKTKIEHMKYGKITGDFCVSDEADVDLLKKPIFRKRMMMKMPFGFVQIPLR